MARTYWKESDAEGVYPYEAMHGGDGTVRMRRFFKDVSKVGVTFDVWELDPGVSEGNHVHEGERSLEETYYFLEGEGVMWIAGEDVPVAAGDAVLVPPGVDHGFRNTGSGPLRLVVLFGKPSE